MKKSKILNLIIAFLAIMIVIVLTIICVSFYKNKALQDTYVISLLGLENVTIYEGDSYSETGYTAKDLNGNDVTSLVKIKGSVNSNVVGKYEIVYSINTFFKRNKVVRVVNVLENPLKDVNFSLNGEVNLEFDLNDEYSELGFKCLDKNNFDCSNYVTVNSNVLMNKVGNYTVDYILKIGGKEKRLTRVIEVIGSSYEYKLDKENIVNTDVIIEFQSNLSNLDYIINPNGQKVNTDVVNYSVSSNGNYKFIMYDKSGVSTEVSVEVSNIDKEAPTGSCKAIINKNSTVYNVNATDNTKIVKYVHESYLNDAYTDSSFEISSRIENGSILVYDEALNYTRIVCDTDYSYIGVFGNNSIYEYTSDTLKYWVEKPNSNYHVMHIWMDDPYNQMKTALSSPFGTLSTAKSILNNEISDKGYSNKGIVAVNGSAFVSSEFDQYFYQKISAWKNTAVTPIVIYDGTVIRNFTNQVLPSSKYFVYGLTKNGNLKYYSFNDVTDTVTNKKISQNIIDDGVKYTFGFEPILVWNEQRVVNSSSTVYKRQAIGQIDKNNFVIVSTSNLSLNFIADHMLTLGCHTGFNLDGGGSISLIYKGKSNQMITLRESSREVADVLYFIEK